jgi:hypothetical protein
MTSVLVRDLSRKLEEDIEHAIDRVLYFVDNEDDAVSILTHAHLATFQWLAELIYLSTLDKSSKEVSTAVKHHMITQMTDHLATVVKQRLKELP